MTEQMRAIIMNHFKNKLRPHHHLLSIVLLLLMMTNIVYGQEKAIEAVKGVVKNDAGEVLAGASISIKGSKIFTTSKGDGSFVLTNVPEGAIIGISYVGYTRIEIKLKPGQTEVAVRMLPSSNTLNEVVVNNGLYKRPAGNFTGAAKSFTGFGNVGTIGEN